jgi:hypothetical protein
MKLYHQCGYNYIWNIDSFVDDKAGDGLIISPVNISKEKLISLPKEIKSQSFFDPQFYIMDDNKGELGTFDFFPGNIHEGFNTEDLKKHSRELAEKCISFQIENGFNYIVIPARHYEPWPTGYYEEFTDLIITPFLDFSTEKDIKNKLLLTVIVKQYQLMDEEDRNYLLSWITQFQEIGGVYLIFENNFTSKQIKDTGYLFNALLFIDALKENNLEVHIGYTNTEAILFSVANPDSVTIGAYANLRNFSIDRFITLEERPIMQQPRPRIYSGKLYQWIDYAYIEALQMLYKNMDLIFEDTKYKPSFSEPSDSWHFTRPELCKHYFMVFSQQIKSLPDNIEDRTVGLVDNFTNALEIFDKIKNCGIPLDSDSDGSHLHFWISVINMYKEYIKGK